MNKFFLVIPCLLLASCTMPAESDEFRDSNQENINTLDDSAVILLHETNLSGTTGSWKHFEVQVPTGMTTLTVQLSGGNGDADLYVLKDKQPNATTYLCRPYINGNTESCSFPNPTAGKWYVSLHGYRSYSGVTVRAGGPVESAEELVWPNPLGPTNSHAWLREHHAELARIEPRVLVLDVVQRAGLVPVEQTVSGLVAAFKEMTRYHGYSDPDAKPFLQYQVDKIVDLKDPGGAEYPSFWKQSQAFQWDVGDLFTAEFAPRLGYVDPDDPSRYLTMCELFERGVIHELWIAADSGTHNIYENQSRLQVYDEQLQPIAGSFDNCTNGCFHDPLARVNCSVSTRMLEINKGRGVGCGTHASGHAQEHLQETIPYLRDNASRFWGFDLDTRYGLSKKSLYACPYEGNLCVDFPAPDRIASSTTWPGAAFDVTGWGAGCGNIHFPPNGRTQYDYDSSLPALSSCEGYGLGGGTNGADAISTYTSTLANQYESAHGDCGGGWVVYMGQSMPGYGNQAKDTTGAPMLNWWPFLFY